MLTVSKKTFDVSARAFAVAALAATAAAAAPATAGAELWGVEPQAGSPISKRGRLADLRSQGVTAVVVDVARSSPRQRRRLQRAATRARLPIVVMRGRGQCRKARRRAACAVRAPTRRAARRLVWQSRGGPVAVRLSGPAALWRSKARGGRRRLLAIIDLAGSRRFDATLWQRAISYARARPRLDLVVRPVRGGAARGLDRYLALLSGSRGFAPPPATSPAPGAFDAPASIFVSPTGKDGAPCSAQAPCRSFDRAYRAAEPGDVVEVAAGAYPSQWVRKDASKAAGPVVLFRPAAGARVVIATDLDVEGAHLEFRGMTLAENWYARPGSHHLTFRNMGAQRLQIASASQVRVLGGDYGPSVDAVSSIKAADSGAPPRDILLDGVRVHDYTRSNVAQHMECLHVMAGTNLTIRNSRFDACSIFGISFNEHGDTGGMRGILVENNWFGDVLDGGGYAVHFSSGAPCEAIVRFNTFQHSGVSQDCPEAGAGVAVSSNILPRSPAGGVMNGYHWDYNVYQRGEKVGPHDVVGSVAFRDPGGFDLAIAAGSLAVGRGDPGAFPPTDIHGEARSAPPDAGADEVH